MIKEVTTQLEDTSETVDTGEIGSPEEIEVMESQAPPEDITKIINLSNIKYDLELWPTHHDVTEQVIKNVSEMKIKVRVTAETLASQPGDDLFCEDGLGDRFKVGLQKKQYGEEVEVEIEAGENVKVYLNTFTKDEYKVEEFDGVMIFEVMGKRLDVPVHVKVSFLPFFPDELPPWLSDYTTGSGPLPSIHAGGVNMGGFWILANLILTGF